MHFSSFLLFFFSFSFLFPPSFFFLCCPEPNSDPAITSPKSTLLWPNFWLLPFPPLVVVLGHEIQLDFESGLNFNSQIQLYMVVPLLPTSAPPLAIAHLPPSPSFGSSCKCPAVATAAVATVVCLWLLAWLKRTREIGLMLSLLVSHGVRVGESDAVERVRERVGESIFKGWCCVM